MSPVPFFTAGGMAALLLLFGVPYPLLLVAEALLTLRTHGRAGLILPWIYTVLGVLAAGVFLLNFVGVGFRGSLHMPEMLLILTVLAVCCLPALLLWGLYALCRHVKRKRLEADELKRMEIQDL